MPTSARFSCNVALSWRSSAPHLCSGGGASGAASISLASRSLLLMEVEKEAKRRSRSAAAAIVFWLYSIGSWYL